MLNSRQRAQLRGLANDFETILQVGKMGISENTVKQGEFVVITGKNAFAWLVRKQ